MTLKNGFGNCSFFFLISQCPLLIIMEKTLFDWPIVLQCDVKAKNRLIPRKLSGRKLSVHLANQKPRAFVSF